MNCLKLSFVLVVAGALMVPASAQESPSAFAARPMPAWSGTGSDGKTYTQADLMARPTLLVFLKEGCPCGSIAMPDLKRLARSLDGVANVFAVSDMTPEEARNFAKEQKMSFPLLADPQHELIAPLRIENGLQLALVSPLNRTVLRVWDGYSGPTFLDVISWVRRQGVTARALDVAHMPTSLVTGCAFGPKPNSAGKNLDNLKGGDR